jgi:site-specific DNA-cytosine methylase
MDSRSFYEVDCCRCGAKIRTLGKTATCGKCGLEIELESWQVRHAQRPDGLIVTSTPPPSNTSASREPACNTRRSPLATGNVTRYGDVRTLTGGELERVELICAGYPCQPFSQAGKRKGTADERHLWPEVARLAGLLRPRYLLLENVPGHLSLGFGDVLGDLARLGFDAEWRCYRAADFGASHLRKRVFIVGLPVARHLEFPNSHDRTSQTLMTQTAQFERERAKRLYAAVMSSRMGTSFQTEYRRVEDVGPFWYELASIIENAVTEKVQEMLKPEKRVIQ